MEDIKSVNDQAFFTSINMIPTNIIIQNNNTTVEIRDNGDFLINDRLVETDIEVYESFKKLLGLLPYEQ